MSSLKPSVVKIGSLPSIVGVSPTQLKYLFHKKGIKYDKDLKRFGCYFYPDPDTGLYDLPLEALLYPKIIVTNLVDGGDLVCVYKFKDELNFPVYIKFTFFKIGNFYHSAIVTFNFYDPLGNYKVINIQTYQSFLECKFQCKFPLTRKQALKLFIRSLGEIVLIPFLDFFVDTNQEESYDKPAMIKRSMEFFLGKDLFRPYDKERNVYVLK